MMAHHQRQLPLRVSRDWLRRFHRDQGGSISLASVFAVLLLVFLLGMVMNSARQVDRKVKMQNAADAASYSGGVELARCMNELAFTNHLLSDVFALTAFMREARDRNAESFVDEILENWQRIGPFLAGSPFPKFAGLGNAIREKVGDPPMGGGQNTNSPEHNLVHEFGDWAALASSQMLPVLEDILVNEQIPWFQRTLVEVAPQVVQDTIEEVARRHGSAWPSSPALHGVLWRTVPDPVGGNAESQRRTVPVVDPVMDTVPDQGKYVRRAVEQRRQLSHRYLRDWNNEQLNQLDRFAKMSQFSNLWRIFTCGYLNKLLEEEYPDTNLLMQIRTVRDEITDVQSHVEQDFMFVGVVYGKKQTEFIPGVFKNKLQPDAQAYAELMLFVPRRRLIRVDPPQPPNYPSLPPGVHFPVPWPVVRQPGGWYSERWDLINQNWTAQLVPATATSIPTILSSQPYTASFGPVQLPALQTMQATDLDWVSHH